MSKEETFTVVLSPALDISGQWVSHCLEWDIISQGNSKEDALRMMFECAALTMADDLSEDKNLWDRKSAPKEYWEKWRELNETR